MQEQELISKLIDLEEQAKAHASEYLRLMQAPGNMAKASFHNDKAIKLRSKIKNLMRQIALFRGDLHEGHPAKIPVRGPDSAPPLRWRNGKG